MQESKSNWFKCLISRVNISQNYPNEDHNVARNSNNLTELCRRQLNGLHNVQFFNALF